MNSGLKRDRVVVKTKVVAVVENSVTGEKRTYETPNIVTNDGDLYYQERIAFASPTNFTGALDVFDGIMELYNGASAAPAKGNDRSDLAGLVVSSGQAIDGTYPKLNDGDGDNTGAGAGVLTYRVSYALGTLVDTGIADVIITNPTPGAAEPLLMHAEFGAPFGMTALDSLKVFVNHTLAGV